MDALPKGDDCAGFGAVPKGVVLDVAGAPPNGDEDDIPVEPNALVRAEPVPNGDAEPIPPGFVLPNGEDSGAGVVPPKGDDDAAGAPVCGAPNGDCDGPGVELAPKGEGACMGPLLDVNGEEAGALPPNVDEGIAVDEATMEPVFSRGLGTLYLAANLLNISTSRP